MLRRLSAELSIQVPPWGYYHFVQPFAETDDLTPQEAHVHVSPASRAAYGAEAGSYASSARRRLIISMALWAQSAPLLPALVPARSMACSMVSVVRTPKSTGTPVSSDVWAMPLDTSAHT